MAEVIFLVIVAICIIALFAIEGNRAKQLEKAAFERANQLSIFGKVLNNVYNNRILLFKYRQALATSSIIISLIFVLTNNFHKVRYTIVKDPYGTEFVYDRFTGKLKKKITY